MKKHEVAENTRQHTCTRCRISALCDGKTGVHQTRGRTKLVTCVVDGSFGPGIFSRKSFSRSSTSSPWQMKLKSAAHVRRPVDLSTETRAA